MKKTLIAMGTVVVALAAVFCFMPGCEEDADTTGAALDDYFTRNPYVSDPRLNPSDVTISPTYANVTYAGERVHFEVTGGSGSYTWDVSIDANGTINPQGSFGNRATAIYTVTTAGVNDVIVYDADGDAAIAYISGGFATLSISPATATMATNDTTLILTASGGRTPYTWSEQSDTNNRVSLNPTDGAQTVLTKAAGAPFSNEVVVIQLTDANGIVAYSTITLR